MNKQAIEELLKQFKNEEIDKNKVIEKLSTLTFEDMGHTKLDLHREIRNGYPEVIFGQGKTSEQLIDIIDAMDKKRLNILATHVNAEKAKEVLPHFPSASYNKLAQCLSIRHTPLANEADDQLLIVTAGTSDLHVAEEAKETAEMLGHKSKIISDVGVAGIHRLFARLDEIRQAKVLIVIAGMEGALASVIGGLVKTPIIAVPTSIGYGANMQGLSALMGMLTSCANGITVVNIDNGYGAAYAACKILDNV